MAHKETPHFFTSKKCIHVTHDKSAVKLEESGATGFYNWKPRQKLEGFTLSGGRPADDLYLVSFGFIPQDQKKVQDDHKKLLNGSNDQTNPRKRKRQGDSNERKLIEGYADHSRYGTHAFVVNLAVLLMSYLDSLNQTRSLKKLGPEDLVVERLEIQKYPIEKPRVLLVRPKDSKLLGDEDVTRFCNPVDAIKGKPWNFDVNTLYSFIPGEKSAQYRTWELALHLPASSKLSVPFNEVKVRPIKHDPYECIFERGKKHCPDYEKPPSDDEDSVEDSAPPPTEKALPAKRSAPKKPKTTVEDSAPPPTEKALPAKRSAPKKPKTKSDEVPVTMSVAAPGFMAIPTGGPAPYMPYGLMPQQPPPNYVVPTTSSQLVPHQAHQYAFPHPGMYYAYPPNHPHLAPGMAAPNYTPYLPPAPASSKGTKKKKKSE